VRKSKIALPICFIPSPILQYSLYFHVHFYLLPFKIVHNFVPLSVGLSKLCVYFDLDNEDNTLVRSSCVKANCFANMFYSESNSSIASLFSCSFLSSTLQNSSQQDLFLFSLIYLNCVYFDLDNEDNIWFAHRG